MISKSPVHSRLPGVLQLGMPMEGKQRQDFQIGNNDWIGRNKKQNKAFRPQLIFTERAQAP